MTRADKLIRKAIDSPGGLRFSELCRLAEYYGFELAGTRGSHVTYKRPGSKGLLCFQDSKGEAKAYQVRQLLAELRALGLLPYD